MPYIQLMIDQCHNFDNFLTEDCESNVNMILTNVEPKRKEKKNLNKMDVIALAVNDKGSLLELIKEIVPQGKQSTSKIMFPVTKN